MFIFNQQMEGDRQEPFNSGLIGPDSFSALRHSEVAELVEKDKLMDAVFLYRTLHGASFEEARALVEDIKLRLG